MAAVHIAYCHANRLCEVNHKGRAHLHQSSQVDVPEAIPWGVSLRTIAFSAFGFLGFWLEIKCSIGSRRINI